MKSIIFQIKIVPSSGQSKIELDKNGNLKCFVKSQPEHGKANQELIKLVSKKLKIPQNDIDIISGSASRNKKIKLISNFSDLKDLIAVLIT